MKHFTLLLLLSFCLHLSQNAQAQISFIDDFEAFNVGDYISENSSDWKTWNSKPGTASDCQVTDDKAASGSKSIHVFGSNGNGGGPMDIFLPFQGTYTEGRFTQSMNLYIEEGKNAHFNYQANKTQGQKWTLYGFFRESGLIEINNGNNEFVFSAPFPNDEWFNFELDIDLNSNVWRVKLNGSCIGSFQNSINKVSSVSFYTINDRTNYYMDDVAFSHDENIDEVQNDVGIINMNYKAGQLVGITQNIDLELGNFGSDTITQIELIISKNENAVTEEITGIRLDPGETMHYETETQLTVEEGKNVVSVTLSKINNIEGDDNDCNNVSFTQLEPIKPALYKGVLIEEATGTWCQWCVRGSVFMDRLSEAYEGYFIPIAIHNGDPMVISSYNNFITSFPNFAGFPNAIIARQEATGFQVIQEMEGPFLQEVQKAEPLFARAGVDYDPTTREMKISAFITFLWDREDDYTVQMVITEDGVTGTESGYAQSNAYAGGTYGPMGGYENLPQIVPAESMVYDHVARAIYGLNATEETTITGPFTEGQTVKVDFVHTVPVGQIPNNMYLIPIVLQDGAFVNAGEVSFEDAVQRGIVSTEFERPTNVSAKIFPNPASVATSLDLQLKRPTQVFVEVFDVRGQLILTKDYGKLQGNIEVPLNISTLDNGIYSAKINTDEGVTTKRFIIQK